MKAYEIISGLEKTCFDNPWTENAIESCLSPETGIYCLSDETEKPEGYAFGTVIFDEAELYRIAVLPDSRRKGTGGRLLADFIAECEKRGAVKIFLEVRSKNVPVRKLYERYGFEEISVRKNYYGDDDAVIYIYTIKATPHN